MVEKIIKIVDSVGVLKIKGELIRNEKGEQKHRFIRIAFRSKQILISRGIKRIVKVIKKS